MTIFDPQKSFGGGASHDELSKIEEGSKRSRIAGPQPPVQLKWAANEGRLEPL